MPRLRLFAILCFDSQERREAPRLVYRLDTRGAGLYRRQPVTVPPVPCHLRFTRQRHPPRQVTLPPPYPFSRPAAQRVIEVPALHLWFAVLYPRVEHQAVLAVVVVVVGPLVVHPYHPFRDAVRLLRQPAVFIVAVDIVRIFRDAVTGNTQETSSLDERQAVSVNKHNFGAVMAEAAIGLNFTVPATLKGSTTDDELNVALNIKSLDDFSPDSVARQVPEVNKLLELREALTALKGPMGNLPAFRTQLQALLENEESREQLLKEIGQMSNK